MTIAITKPRDTSKDLPGPFALLLAGTGAIEAQESQGQREAVASQSLPSDIRGREQWESLGLSFGKPFDDDPLFCPATLPPGWSKQASDHSMHVNLVDAAGNKRGSFFYKAAFYDRKADMGPPLRRHHIEPDYDRVKETGYKGEATKVLDRVTGEAVFFSELHMIDDGLSWEQRDKARQKPWDESKAWLAANFPDYESPAAYWPEPSPK